MGDLQRTRDSVLKSNKYFRKQVEKYQGTFEGSESISTVLKWINNVPVVNKAVPHFAAALKRVSTYSKWRKGVYDTGLQTTNELTKEISKALDEAGNHDAKVNLDKGVQMRSRLQEVFDETNVNWSEAQLKEHKSAVGE